MQEEGSFCKETTEGNPQCRRSRARSSSMESLLSPQGVSGAAAAGAKPLLPREVLPGAVKSGSLESLMQGEWRRRERPGSAQDGQDRWV